MTVQAGKIKFKGTSSGLLVPVGTIIWFSKSTVPAGYLLCDGSTYLISTYQDLFDVIGTTYGGNGTTNFDVPDLLGLFIRGWDSGGSIDPSRTFGSQQAHQAQLTSHSHTIPDHDHAVYDHNHSLPDHNHSVQDHNHGLQRGYLGQFWTSGNKMLVADSSTGGPITQNPVQTKTGLVTNNKTNFSTNNKTGLSTDDETSFSTNSEGNTNETRPINIALLPCIRRDYSDD